MYEIGTYVNGVTADGQKILGKYMDDTHIFSLESCDTVEVVRVEDCDIVI